MVQMAKRRKKLSVESPYWINEYCERVIKVKGGHDEILEADSIRLIAGSRVLREAFFADPLLAASLDDVLILAPEFNELAVKRAVDVLTKGETTEFGDESEDEQLRDLLVLFGVENASLEQIAVRLRTEEQISEIEEENNSSRKKQDKVRAYLRKNRQRKCDQQIEHKTKDLEELLSEMSKERIEEDEQFRLGRRRAAVPSSEIVREKLRTELASSRFVDGGKSIECGVCKRALRVPSGKKRSILGILKYFQITHYDKLHRKSVPSSSSSPPPPQPASPPRKEKQRFSCPKCTIPFYSKFSLNRHISRIHGEETHLYRESDFRLKCPICQAPFVTRAFLRDHVQKHSGVPGYLCSQCGKGFFTEDNLNQHSKKHCSKLKTKKKKKKKHSR